MRITNNHKRIRIANGFFSFFMAIKNVDSYATGSINTLDKLLPFTTTVACDIYCANLKTSFLIDIVLLVAVTTIAVLSIKETVLQEKDAASGGPKPTTPFGKEVTSTFKNLSKPMWQLYLVTALNWIAWFPFLLYDTDWMGRKVYGEKAQGPDAEKCLYDLGVCGGALGLLLNSVVLGFASLVIEPASKIVGGIKRWWAIVNFILAGGLACTVPITRMPRRSMHSTLF